MASNNEENNDLTPEQVHKLSIISLHQTLTL